MVRITRHLAVNYDAKVYGLTDVDRTCPVCGRQPKVFLAISNLELLQNEGYPYQHYLLMEAKWYVAKRMLANLPPCDHGVVERTRARYRRRHYKHLRYWR